MSRRRTRGRPTGSASASRSTPIPWWSARWAKHAAGIQTVRIACLGKHPVRTGGAIEADWQIDPNGRVAEAAIIHSDSEDKHLSDGVARVLKDIRYPPPPTGLRTCVAHKFNLKKD